MKFNQSVVWTKHHTYIWVALGGKTYGISPTMLFELTSLEDSKPDENESAQAQAYVKLKNSRMITYNCFRLKKL